VAQMRAALGGQAVVVALSACLLAPPAASAAGQPVFYELPPGTHAHSMTAGPGGAIWFTAGQALMTGEGGSVVGSIGEDGQVQLFPLPSHFFAGTIAAGPDGNLWLAGAFQNKAGYLIPRIGRLSPVGAFAEYAPANQVGTVHSVTAGPDGAIWFTLGYSAKGLKRGAVGRIDGGGATTLFPLPSGSGPGTIVAGADGNLWFTERGGGGPKIGRITPDGHLAHFRLPSRDWRPASIVAGTDGNLWFGEEPVIFSPKRRSRVGRITTAGAITEFRVPGQERTQALAAGPAGNVWFASPLGQGPLAVGSISSTGVVTPPACLKPTPCEVDADALAVGADGRLWFSMSKYYSHRGGGGTGLWEGIAEALEAGFVGFFPAG
jgi:virginiamycin B lyase